MFKNLKKKMDMNVEMFIPSLIKNAGHTNKFIALEAEKALILACENCTEDKIISSSLGVANTRTNNATKEKILLAINTVI